MIKIPDFYEDMAGRGLKPDVKLLDVKVVKANQLVSEKHDPSMKGSSV